MLTDYKSDNGLRVMIHMSFIYVYFLSISIYEFHSKKTWINLRENRIFVYLNDLFTLTHECQL